MKRSKCIVVFTILAMLGSYLALFAMGCINYSGSTKSVDLAQAPPGATLTYTINVINSGDEASLNTVVSDQIDLNLENIANINAGGAYTPGTRTITWSLGTVPSGGGMALTFTAGIITTTPVGTVVQNTASIGYDGQSPQSSNTVSTTVIAPDPLDHFEFATISSPQTVDQSFSVTIYAKDASGQTIDSFEDTANLSDLSGEISPAVTLNTYSAIDAGSHHSLSISSGGSLSGWGLNDQGQTNVPAGSDYASVAGGANHSLALRSDGSLAGWGYNSQGQATPPTGSDFTAVAAGGYHSLALRTDGSLAGWGENGYGQASVPAGNNFVAISAGYYHSLALRANGSLTAWGINNNGQTTVPTGNDFVAISAGAYHCLALKADGTIVGWGYNDHGEATPPTGGGFAAVSAGNYHSLALRTDGSLVAWGYNGYGETNVPAGNNFSAISSGDHHCLALRTDGSLAGWGYNGYGQIDVPAGTGFVAGVFTGMATVGAPYTSDVITATHDGKTGASNAFDVTNLSPDFSTSFKEVDIDEVVPQGTLSYSLQVTNTGAGEAAQTTVTDTLNSNLENISQITEGGTYNPATHKITWNLGTLYPQGQKALAFSAQVKSSTAPGTIIGNQALIECAEAEPFMTSPVQSTVVPGPVHHFGISAISTPQTAHVAFPLTLTALDAFGNTTTSFTSSVNISDTTGTIAPTLSGAFTSGVWSGEVVVGQPAASCNIDVNDGAGHLGQSNQFEVIMDTTYPDAEITYPSESEVLTGMSVMVTGTANDQTFAWWQLSYRLEGSGEWTPLSAPHQSPVINGDLDSWDLSGIGDGIVHLKLTVADLGDLESEDIVSVVVERQNPVAEISWPEDGMLLGGSAQVSGTASDGNLLRYLLSYGEGSNPQVWHPISPNQSGLEVAQEESSSLRNLYLNNGNNLAAQAFKVSNGYVDSIDLRFKRYGSADVQIGLKICEVASGAPTSNIVAESTTTYDFSQISETSTWHTFEFRNEELQPGTDYCIVLYRTDGVVDSSSRLTFEGSNSDVYIGEPAWYFHASVWSVLPNFDFAFHIRTYTEEALYGYSQVSGGVLATWNTVETPDGTYTLKLEVEDKYGKQASDQITVVTDRTRPLANISSPQSGSYIRGTVDINGSANDAHFLKYQLFYGPGSTPSQYSALSSELTDPVTDGLLYSWNTTTFTDGTYTLKLVASDQVGLVSEETITVTVDNTSPTAAITSPGTGTAVCGTLEVKGSASDTNFASYAVRYTQDTDPDASGAKWTDMASESLPPAGANLCSLDTTSLAEVALWLELSVSDKAGNISTVRTSVSPDNTYPEVRFERPEEGRVYGNVQISGVVYDKNLTSYSLYDWDGASSTPLVTEETVGTGTHPEDLFLWNTSSLTEGEHMLVLRATDAAGHQTTAVRRVRVDNAPPVGNIQILGKDADGVFTNSSIVKLRLNASDAEYLKIWNYDADHPDYVPEDAYLLKVGGGSYTGVLTRSWMLPGALLPTTEGLKQVSCQFIDSCGALSPIYSDTIILEVTPPTISVTSPERQSTGDTGLVNFDFHLTDPLNDPERPELRSGLERVEIWLTAGGTPLEPVYEEQLAGEDCTISQDIDLGERGYGYYDFIIKAFDKAGNAATSHTFSYRYAGVSDWPMAGHDLANSRYNSGMQPGEMLWPYKRIWKDTQSFGNYAYRGDILASDGYIYFSEKSYYEPVSAIRKLVASNGLQNAAYAIQGTTEYPDDYSVQGICLTGSDTDGRVIVLTKKRVIILKRDGLTFISSRKMSDYYGDDGEFCGNPVVSGDFLYLPIYKNANPNGSRMLALDISALNPTLNQVWEFYGTANRPSSPAVAEGKLVFTCFPNLYVLDAATGGELSTLSDDYSGRPTLYNNHIYVASGGYYQTKLSIIGQGESGFVEEVETESIYHINEEIACANGMIYATSSQGQSPGYMVRKVWAFDAATGSTMWVKDFTRNQLFGFYNIGAPTVADGLVFVGFCINPGFFDLSQTHLSVFDAYTGQPRYETEATGANNTNTVDPTVTVSDRKAFMHYASNYTMCYEPEYSYEDLGALGFNTFCGFYDGVNTSLGSFTQEATDVNLPGRGINLDFKRTYNSLKPDSGYSDNGIGAGWDFSYNVYIEEVKNGTNLTALKVHRGDGRVDTYTKEGETFKAPPGVFDDLTAGSFAGMGSGVSTLYTLKVAGGNLWEFDSMGEKIVITRVVNDHGDSDNILTLNYTGDPSRLTSIEAPGGKTLTITWDGGKITKLEDPLARTVEFTYESDNLRYVKDIYGAETEYQYDGDCRLTTIREPEQLLQDKSSKSISYYGSEDPNKGMVSETKDADDNVTSFNYATTSHMTAITDPCGYTTTHRYDTMYRLIQEVNNDGQSTTYSFGDDGNGKSVRDPMGRITQFLSEEGLVKRIISPDGGVRDFTYDDRDRLVSETDGAGHTKTYTYNENNNLISSTDFADAETRYFYTDDNNPGLVTLKVSPNINALNGPRPTTGYCYDASGQLTGEVLFASWNNADPANAGADVKSVNNYTYDVVGRKTSESLGRQSLLGPAKLIYDYTYDDDATDGLRGITKTNMSYHLDVGAYSIYPTEITLNDRNGRLAEVIKSRGDTTPDSDIMWVKTSYTYDNNNRETARKLYTSNSTATPQPAESFIQVNVTATKTYQVNGFLHEERDYSGRTTTYTYDSAGRKAEQIDGEGRVTTFEYAADGQLAKRVDPNATGSVIYSYDSAGRQATEERKFTSLLYGEMSYKTAKAYDTRGNVISEVTTRPVPNPTTSALGGLSYREAVTTYTYGAEKRVLTSSATTGEGQGNVATTFTYDPSGNKLSETKSGPGTPASTTTFTYNYQGKVETEARGCTYGTTTENPTVTFRSYDTLGNMLSETVCDDYSYSANILSHRTYTYNGLQKEESVSAALGVEGNGFSLGTYNDVASLALTPVSSSSYFCDGLPRQKASHNQNSPDQEVTYSYDAAEKKTREALSLGGGSFYVKTSTYDGSGNLLSEAVGDGTSMRTTSYLYDQVNRETAKILPQVGSESPAQRTYTYQYNDSERKVTLTDPEGRVTVSSLDDLGRTEAAEIPGADGSLTLRAYDQAGNVIRQSTRLERKQGEGTDTFGETFQRYNDLGKLAETKVLSGQAASPVLLTTTNTYDYAGNLTATTTPGANTSTYAYDSLGRLRRQFLPHEGETGIVTTYSYDSLGRKTLTLEGEQNPDGTRFTYDGLSNLRKVEQWSDHWTGGVEPPSESKATTTYGVDLTGNLLSQTDARGNTTTYAYDAGGRVVEKTDPLSQEETFTYNPYGEVKTHSYTTADPARTLTNFYDARGRLTTESVTESNSTREKIDYSYDHAGNITGSTYDIANGVDINRAIGLTYDDSSRLNEVICDTDGAAGTYSTSYDYYDSGALASRTLTAGGSTPLTSNYTYDVSGRLTLAQDPVSGGSFAFTWDSDSRLTRVDLPNSAGYTQYSYYGEGLTHTQAAYTEQNALQASYDYTYNDRAKRTQMDISLAGSLSNLSGTYDYGYDGMGRLETFTPPQALSDPTSYSYDKVGNLLQKTTGAGTKSYTYDNANQIATDSDETTYVYDEFGNLTQKGTEQMTYDGLGRLASFEKGEDTCTFSYDSMGRLTERKVGGETERAFRYDGTSLSQAQETNASGEVVSNYALTPSGTHLAQNNQGVLSYLGLNPHTDVSYTLSGAGVLTGAKVYDPYGSPLAGSLVSSLGFQEDYKDPTSGLVWMGARWYSPELTRFLTIDPVKGENTDPLSQNPYLYCKCDPINSFDPTGMEDELNQWIALNCSDEEIAKIIETSNAWLNNNALLNSQPGSIKNSTLSHEEMKDFASVARRGQLLKLIGGQAIGARNLEAFLARTNKDSLGANIPREDRIGIPEADRINMWRDARKYNDDEYIEKAYDGTTFRVTKYTNNDQGHNEEVLFEAIATTGGASGGLPQTQKTNKAGGIPGGPAPYGAYRVAGKALDTELASDPGFGRFDYVIVGVGETYQRFGRTGLRIHDDGNYPGTNGCIAFNGKEPVGSSQYFPTIADALGIPYVDQQYDEYHENQFQSTNPDYNEAPIYLFVEYPNGANFKNNPVPWSY